MASVKAKCNVSGDIFEISPFEQEFFKKMNLPHPLISPKYREIMRMAFRNDRNLYKRKCDFSGKPIISVYHPKSPFKVYEVEIWNSDKWEIPYLDYDPKKNFFNQYRQLQLLTPRVNLFSVYNENCDYVNAAEKNKNCYMVFVTDRCEDSYYMDACFTCKDCADCSYTYDSELGYELVDCRALYNSKYCYLCENSSDINFCFDLKGCSNCFLSSGLRNQKYYILNKQYTAEEYQQKIREINFSSNHMVEELKKKFFKEIMPPSYSKIINCEDSTGNFLINCRNCHDCFDCQEAQDCVRVRVGVNGIKDIMDAYAVVDGSELIFNNIGTTESYNCHNMTGCWTTKDSSYSEYLQGCRDCFGCISLKQKRFCILNKQYTEAEYKEIKADIIKKMGDYYGSNFPISLAPFCYQDSAYKDYFELSREEVEKIGWRWEDQTGVSEKAEAEYSVLPDSGNDFPKEDCQKVFKCQKSGKAFKIVEQELRLLKKIQAPLPRLHYDERFKERVRLRKS